ncbi:lipocalin-like domain-containing protein [Cupriavidus lacunae]|uniref:Lipocalin-like domain-containing protein n=1 Tax=Cupriavidus lacunae TaxID=2666307 RepID=A0A370P0G8_9BURK|nr:lipocalin-like domain-containing protein [Cupriavidus lacunae]RDK11379.1 hypothetical protein DN412_06070 [Cupriavidus lacunae]
MEYVLRKHAAVAAFLLAAILPATGALAQSANGIAGTWTLVSSVLDRGGTKVDQFGPGAQGMMILDDQGRFMLTIIGDIPKFASGNRATGTPEENKAMAGGSIALFGSYAVSPDSKTLAFRIDKSSFPNWDGTEQKRSIVLLSDVSLQYLTAQASGGGSATVTWKRAR